MTSIGASSGEPRTAPLGYTRDGDRYVVVGSNSGLPQQPGWLANIRANPVVKVEVGVETFQARATITTGAERQRLWTAHVAAIPHFANYEKMTERELQVVTIERVAAER
jgi:deazaflavin-dependent oxidoreductase (nitroreductase family)